MVDDIDENEKDTARRGVSEARIRIERRKK